MKTYAVTFRPGMTLVKASCAIHARRYCELEWGRSMGPYNVSEATDEDVAYAEAMGCVTHEADV
jgi:hypothetical protein